MKIEIPTSDIVEVFEILCAVPNEDGHEIPQRPECIERILNQLQPIIDG